MQGTLTTVKKPGWFNNKYKEKDKFAQTLMLFDCNDKHTQTSIICVWNDKCFFLYRWRYQLSIKSLNVTKYLLFIMIWTTQKTIKIFYHNISGSSDNYWHYYTRNRHTFTEINVHYIFYFLLYNHNVVKNRGVATSACDWLTLQKIFVCAHSQSQIPVVENCTYYRLWESFRQKKRRNFNRWKILPGLCARRVPYFHFTAIEEYGFYSFSFYNHPPSLLYGNRIAL